MRQFMTPVIAGLAALFLDTRLQPNTDYRIGHPFTYESRDTILENPARARMSSMLNGTTYTVVEIALNGVLQGIPTYHRVNGQKPKEPSSTKFGDPEFFIDETGVVEPLDINALYASLPKKEIDHYRNIFLAGVKNNRFDIIYTDGDRRIIGVRVRNKFATITATDADGDGLTEEFTATEKHALPFLHTDRVYISNPAELEKRGLDFLALYGELKFWSEQIRINRLPEG